MLMMGHITALYKNQWVRPVGIGDMLHLLLTKAMLEVAGDNNNIYKVSITTLELTYIMGGLLLMLINNVMMSVCPWYHS